MSHPIHPALVHFPIACWTLATFCDFAGLFTAAAWHIAAVFLVAGTLLAIPAMLAGMLELASVGEDSQVTAIARRHVGAAVIAFSMYAITLARRAGPEGVAIPSWTDLILSAGGFLTLVLTAWLGGSLVYTHGVGSRQKSEN
jgi:uncharacterized membrane protein